jgi:FkbM family methyltransferase
MKRILDKNLIYSYSQTGEDRIIQNCFDCKLNGYYVDVGSNHPIKWSNTFLLYKNGWHGIVIDANKELINLHRKIRKNDKALCEVVSDSESEVVFTEFYDSVVSSLSSNHVEEWSQKRAVKSQKRIDPVTLQSIFVKNNCPRTFDLLCIDVEDHDYEVLSSFDLNIYRPQLIVIEMHGLNVDDIANHKIVTYLQKNNYVMAGFATMNGYFKDNL